MHTGEYRLVRSTVGLEDLGSPNEVQLTNSKRFATVPGNDYSALGLRCELTGELRQCWKLQTLFRSGDLVAAVCASEVAHRSGLDQQLYLFIHPSHYQRRSPIGSQKCEPGRARPPTSNQQYVLHACPRLDPQSPPTRRRKLAQGLSSPFLCAGICRR
jgi:hypothetical protein